MLIARHTKLYARAFVNSARLSATAANFRLVSEALSDDRLLPVQATEQGPAGTTQRIAFQDSTCFQVVVGSDSFVVQHVPANGTLPAFLERAAGVFERLLPLLPHVATRVALIQEGHVTVSEPDHVARSLFRFPPPFDATLPFEWDWRCATRAIRRFGALNEEMNTVAIFRRAAGQLPWGEAFDGIIAELDVNTIAGNLVPRFGAAECKAFLEAGRVWQDELARGLAEFIQHGKPS